MEKTRIRFIQRHFICRPSNSSVSEDVAIEPRTVATSALAFRRSNRSARYHSQARLDLIHITRLDLIYSSARSHPLLGLISLTKNRYLFFCCRRTRTDCAPSWAILSQRTRWIDLSPAQLTDQSSNRPAGSSTEMILR